MHFDLNLSVGTEVHHQAGPTPLPLVSNSDSQTLLPEKRGSQCAWPHPHVFRIKALNIQCIQDKGIEYTVYMMSTS